MIPLDKDNYALTKARLDEWNREMERLQIEKLARRTRSHKPSPAARAIAIFKRRPAPAASIIPLALHDLEPDHSDCSSRSA